MADISQITLPDGSVYKFKDEQARLAIAGIDVDLYCPAITTEDIDMLFTAIAWEEGDWNQTSDP